MECNVCAENYNKSNKSQVNCNYCDFGACRECIQTFLLNKVHVPACMSCDREWPREFVDDNFTKKFTNGELKKHREKILFDKEQCHLPHAQNYIHLENERKELYRALADIHHQAGAIRHEILGVDNQMERGEFARRKFIRKCPHEGCRGFLSSQWKCDVCENWTCPDCNEIKGKEKEGDHQCDPGNVETAKLLKKDTKSCPNCGILIFKISGCAQMWCTECNTAFDWASLRIIRTQIHNPHFFEARRRAGVNLRDLTDIPCGGLPSKRELMLKINPESKPGDLITAIWQGELQRPCMPGVMYVMDFVCHLNGLEPSPEANNLALRVQYLKQEISQERLNFQLQVRDKKYQKKREEFAVIDMVRTTLTDFLRQFVVGEMSYENCIDDTNKIIEYANGSLNKIAMRYKQTVLFFCINTQLQNRSEQMRSNTDTRVRNVFCYRDEYTRSLSSSSHVSIPGQWSSYGNLIFPKYFILS